MAERSSGRHLWARAHRRKRDSEVRWKRRSGGGRSRRLRAQEATKCHDGEAGAKSCPRGRLGNRDCRVLRRCWRARKASFADHVKQKRQNDSPRSLLPGEASTQGNRWLRHQLEINTGERARAIASSTAPTRRRKLLPAKPSCSIKRFVR